MSDVRSILERGVGGAAPPPDGYERLLRRRDKKHRNQRLWAGVLALLIILVVAGTFARLLTAEPIPGDQTPTPTSTPSPTATPEPPKDVLVDVQRADRNPVPLDISTFDGGVGNYQISPDGSRLLFDGRDDAGFYCRNLGGCDITQIYIANVDGSGVRRLTDEPDGAVAGSWSPDGSMIAYVAGWAQRGGANLSVIDVSTGSITRLAHGLPEDFIELPPPRFSPDGRAILFTGDGNGLWTVPVEGGPIVRLSDDGIWGSYSPDGTRIVYLRTRYSCCVEFGRQEVFAGDGIVIAEADGGNPRRLVEGTFHRVLWSPDGTKLVAERSGRNEASEVVVIDVATARVTRIVNGERPTWFDDETLILE